jgi:hypothetical protein
MASCISTTKDGERCKRVSEEGVCWQHKSQLLHKAKIIHSTAIVSLQKIVESGILYDSGELIKRRIFESGGEGNIAVRKCCNPYLYTLQEQIPKSCDEACATYFRLLLEDTPLPGIHKGKCLISFSTQILCEDDVEWHINTCENNGFLISGGIAYYGDCYPNQRTILKRNIATFTRDEYNRTMKDMELVITQSVPIEYILTVYFGNQTDFDDNREFLRRYGIKATLLN